VQENTIVHVKRKRVQSWRDDRQPFVGDITVTLAWLDMADNIAMHII